MTTTLLTSESKEALRKSIRSLRTVLLDELSRAAKGEYQLDVAAEKARLSAAQRARRRRLEDYLDEQVRASHSPTKAAKGAKSGKASKADEGGRRDRFFAQAVAEAAHTLLNRLVLVRILEHHGLLAPDAPRVVTGGWKSAGYAGEFLGYAGPLAEDDARGYRDLLEVIFAELAIELPGLFGKVGLTSLFPVPASTLRAVIDVLNDPALDSAWGDDTTLGWVYQYWNDPSREALDAKIAGGGKIEPHEIASKTQMFTERYMVEWLLQNSLGFTWLCICKKSGWTADAERVLPELDARRAAWRTKREAGEVALDALMPIAEGLEADWKYYVPQPISDDAVAKAPASIADVKLLDPACGSGHFLVIAFGLLARMYEEEARHRGEEGEEAWSAAEIARRIVADNLHGIDIDPRAIQIAAASLWLRARVHARESGDAQQAVRLSRMNLVAPTFRLAALPKDDPARVALEAEFEALGVPRATTVGLVDALAGVDHLGTLLRVDHAIGALLDDAEAEGPLFAHGAKKQRARLTDLVASFLDAHAAESDLGLRLEGEQVAAGVRFIGLAKEGRYDVVVGNPPYQGISKTAGFEYVVKNYPRSKADLYAAFLERGLELVRKGGVSALLTMRGWMFLAQFKELRLRLLHEEHLRLLLDLDSGAFDEVSAAQVVLSVAGCIFRRAEPASVAIAVRPTPSEDRASAGMTGRKRAGLLAQVGRYEFDPKAFGVIEGEPVVYWWTNDLLSAYAQAPKLKELGAVRQGMATTDNTRFLRCPWEVSRHDLQVHRYDFSAMKDGGGVCGDWVPYIKGAAGASWLESLDDAVLWRDDGLELKLYNELRYGSFSRNIKNAAYYFRCGVAFSMIGSTFQARAHRYKSVIGHMGSSVFGSDVPNLVCLMNTSRARFVLGSINPGVHFEVGDVNRLPAFPIHGASEIFATIEANFDAAEAAREASIEFRRPGPSSWRYAQNWAQQAVDRPEGAALPPYLPSYDPVDPEADLSHAIGVGLGRFSESGEGVIDDESQSGISAGLMFIGPNDACTDSLKVRSAAPSLLAVWETFAPTSGKKPPLREWLRKDFFAYHKNLYKNRPIYFPLSSEKRNFVAWISIHRFTDATLPTLLADHLNPALRELDADIRDANTARTSSDKKLAVAAAKTYDTAKRLRDELADFIALVAQCAERGAPPTDPGCPPREVDAPFSMDLDDGVMINSAALWPLLAPQWSDPKKWWKQLCLAEGKKDYDWAHLSKRYFPTRVDEKCKADPSLAVAHGCFWRYHPAKAFAWELRLQDEIRPDFTIDEVDSDEHRAAYLRDHAADAEAARVKERIRRERKAAKQDDAGDSEAEESDETTEDDVA